MTTLFQVPRREVPVLAQLDGGDEVEGRLYAPAERPGGGPGLLTDRLNAPEEQFLPLGTGKEGWLLNKERIVSIHIALGEVPEEIEGPELHRVEVRIALAGGQSYEGSLCYAMPEGRERVVDYLNSVDRFLPIEVGEHIVLINRDYIVSLRGHEV